MKDLESSFMKMEKFVKWFIGIVAVLLVLMIIGQVAFAVFVGSHLFDAVQNGEGIKGIVEQLWFGKGGN